ncbi:hypothetical protein Hypma_012708 [Hypsizygus marmoreus]|uniref:Uncharacterized protein n=1 Tax=Hypsizygus marmoreus TaxID=39966 RepID=A0A369JLS9_HYPMA|nr:hypothetical protein Hypma_012708 [Hypsizygus marmoreus]
MRTFPSSIVVYSSIEKQRRAAVVDLSVPNAIAPFTNLKRPLLGPLFPGTSRVRLAFTPVVETPIGSSWNRVCIRGDGQEYTTYSTGRYNLVYRLDLRAYTHPYSPCFIFDVATSSVWRVARQCHVRALEPLQRRIFSTALMFTIRLTQVSSAKPQPSISVPRARVSSLPMQLSF